MLRLLPLLLFLPLVALGGVPRKRPADHVRGKELWERSCWQCHGTEARGDGPATESLVQPVPDLRGVIGPERQSDLVDTILFGKGIMPAFSEELDRYQARKILVYLRRLEEHEEDENEGEEAPTDAPPQPQEDENRSAQEVK